MLFVGEKKGYDLDKALAATSVREFDAAISRVAYGFETLEDFYATASSLNNISSVQTPLLFIQVSLPELFIIDLLKIL
jgi:predicted alpha/beta-fold hydrolase